MTKNQKIILIISIFSLTFLTSFAIYQALKSNSSPQTSNKTQLIYEEYTSSNTPERNEEIYQKILQTWKNQCFFKPGYIYSPNEIYNKLGKDSRTLYSNTDGKFQSNDQQYDYVNSVYYGSSIYALYYQFCEGIFGDKFYLKKSSTKLSWWNVFEPGQYTSSDVCANFRNITFTSHFDTSRPPLKPNTNPIQLTLPN